MSIATLRTRFINVCNTNELIENLLDKLPFNNEDCKVNLVQGSVKKFKCVVDCNINDVKEFISRYNERTNETLRIASTKNLSLKNTFSKYVYLRCHHNTRYQGTMSSKDVIKQKPSKRFKNTDCPYTSCLKFKRNESTFNCTLEIEWTHNHSIQSLQTLSFKDINENVRREVFGLFDKGFTPGLAYKEFWRLAKESCATTNELDLLTKTSDRSIFPRRTDYNQLYTVYHQKKYGSKNMDSMFNTLDGLIKKFQKDNPETILKFQRFDSAENDPFILVIVTDLMLRVHEKVRSSGEMVFIDSSGGMEEFCLRIFLIVTHSPMGALPLGIIVTSDETTDTLTQAFEMYATLLPENAFYKSMDGPAIIMTDNCDELYDGLRAVWPKSKMLLCLFHMMQQVWRWLFDKNHSILQADRPEIMKLFRKVAYANEIEESETLFYNLLDQFGIKYPALQAYLETLFEYRQRWCLSYRETLMIRGNHTNNFVEAQFLVLKDNILNRTKEVNINGLLEKLLKDFNDHYKLKLMSVSSGRYDGIYSNRFMGKSKQNEAVGFKLPSNAEQSEVRDRVRNLGSNIYEVPSFSKANINYHVNMELGVCECYVGKDGTPCKHQYVTLMIHQKSINFIPYLSLEDRKQCSYIALGSVLDDSYYEALHEVPENFEITIDASDADNISYDTSQVGVMDSTFEAGESENTGTIPLNDNRRSIEKTTLEDCEKAIADVGVLLTESIKEHPKDLQLLNGIVKFRDRLKKYKNQPSKLTTSLHSFGVATHFRKSTITTMSKRKAGKISVQPEAVKRRKNKNGSKTAIIKGMSKKQNPFVNRTISKKRPHSFSNNVSSNEPVSKKAGRSMSSKTKKLSKRQKKIEK